MIYDVYLTYVIAINIKNNDALWLHVRNTAEVIEYKN